ncbi:MAG: gliding motility-associated C-terminal domain-containing protein, partial [Flavobacteriales bacterium]|nr:gliding motility-associated C-terminal domain-containing protein [Flavobacteriales bacterium]
VNRLWSHGVSAFDVDGDSLAFELIPCTGGNGQVVPGYVFPDDFLDGGPNGEITFDQEFGIVTWDSPMTAGLYNIAIRISEYRFGFIVGSVVRDMQIFIDNCPNQPPINDELPDVCVIANEDLVVQYTAEDPDGDPLELFMEGEPLELGAAFTQLSVNPASASLQWTPSCQEVRTNPYLVYLRAEDNSESPALSDNDGFTITVIGPPVENLTSSLEPGGTILLEWDDYVCSDEASGFKIYRRIGTNPFEPGECETGLDESEGYTLIGTEESGNTTSFLDMTVPFGNEVCYRVVACYPDGAESIVSAEVCDTIALVIPVLTNVSVGETDLATGIDTVRWFPPLELDTTFFSGPYSYKIYRAEGLNGQFEEIFQTPNSSFLDIGMLEYIDAGLNTQDIQYRYQIDLLDNGDEIASSNSASSILLSVTPSDEEVTLTWNEVVPWVNTLYEVYRFDNDVNDFVIIGNTEESVFIVDSLENNVEECFLIKSLGGYSNPDYAGPFENWSQEECSTPFDNQAPCPPELFVEGECEDDSYTIFWSLLDDKCSSDVAGFNVYYSPNTFDSLQLIQTIDQVSDTVLEFNDGDLYGCFAVSAFDSLSTRPDGSLGNNESELSNIICIESCPEYELPNVFSPNGDGLNDSFMPFPYTYVDSVDLKIFNRWGNLIFETFDPDINWKGENKDTGSNVSDGVYYYTITIFENTLLGMNPRKEAGYIHIFDNRSVPSEE